MSNSTGNTAKSPLSWSVIPAVLATGGVGHIPFAPGTWGTLLGFPLAWAIRLIPGNSADLPCVLAILGAGAWLGDLARGHFHSEDPQQVVCDEYIAFAGLLVVDALLFPLRTWQQWWILFGIFRLFDILKPFPIKYLERLPGGLGIMADDIGAAFLASLVAYLLKI